MSPKLIYEQIESMNTLIGVLDKLGVGIPIDALMVEDKFANGAVAQFVHPCDPKTQMTIAFSLIHFIEQEGYVLSHKKTESEGMLAYCKGAFFIGIIAGNSDGLFLYHDRVNINYTNEDYFLMLNI